MIIIPKIVSYTLPEGQHRVALQEVFETREGLLRLVFKVISITHPRKHFHAGKNYQKQGDKRLSTDLDSWLGDDLDEYIDQATGGITIDSLKSLIGREADIDVVLIDNDDYPGEFRHINKIKPPGTMVPQPENKAA